MLCHSTPLSTLRLDSTRFRFDCATLPSLGRVRFGYGVDWLDPRLDEGSGSDCVFLDLMILRVLVIEFVLIWGNHNWKFCMSVGYPSMHGFGPDGKLSVKAMEELWLPYRWLDENPIRTLRDYSKPSHEGYRNAIELPVGNNVVPLRSDTIRLVQNGCSFHGLRSEYPNQHLNDFLKLVDSLDLDGKNRERRRMRLFQFSLRDQTSNWLEHLLAGSITTWEDLTTRFLAQLFPSGRIAKLCNDILMFQQHHGESLLEAWTHFKDLLQKVPHHGIDH
ncbi:zinc finger, CCHC-type containing protein [Tanacetum coccineum]